MFIAANKIVRGPTNYKQITSLTTSFPRSLFFPFLERKEGKKRGPGNEVAPLREFDETCNLKLFPHPTTTVALIFYFACGKEKKNPVRVL